MESEDPSRLNGPTKKASGTLSRVPLASGWPVSIEFCGSSESSPIGHASQVELLRRARTAYLDRRAKCFRRGTCAAVAIREVHENVAGFAVWRLERFERLNN